MTKQLALAVVASAIFAGGAHAQTRPKPDDPVAPVAPLAFDSAFKGYQSFREEPLAPWRDVNDTVHRVGGHVGVLRTEQQSAAQPAAGTTPMAPPTDAMPRGMHGDKAKK